jgi:hypothetical protein
MSSTFATCSARCIIYTDGSDEVTIILIRDSTLSFFLRRRHQSQKPVTWICLYTFSFFIHAGLCTLTLILLSQLALSLEKRQGANKVRV